MGTERLSIINLRLAEGFARSTRCQPLRRKARTWRAFQELKTTTTAVTTRTARSQAVVFAQISSNARASSWPMACAGFDSITKRCMM